MVETIYKIQNPGPRWDTVQATGPPDTPGSGDITTAWASSSPDGMREWLVLDYDRPVIPKTIEIHETYNPGAVDRVTIFRDDGTEVTVWRGVDPTLTSASRGISKIPINVDFAVQRVKIYINSPAVPGWNEIDAVGIVDTSGKKHWAEKAYASSSFGLNRKLSSWYE